MKLDGIRQKVFLDRYSLKDPAGNAMEKTPEEMWRRVAKGIAGVEKPKDRKKWERRFYEVMEDFKFLPGGRILAGAGTGFDVTYYNCFVIPNPPDSRGGIMANLTQMIEIMAHGGGVGLNLSSLRPRGARVKKVNGFSSGPINWAELYSLATKDIVQQGGSRRGALMLMLHDWHPDIEEFITVKQDLNKINGANLSVCLSDAFMEAVKKDANWDLVYPDLDDPKYDKKWTGDLADWKKIGGKVKVLKTIKAKYLWDLICTAAWTSAEPGLHFLDRSNKRSNTYYFETLIATNPCVTDDTWVHTKDGPRQVRDLIGKQFVARLNGTDVMSGSQGFFKTATKQVIKLQTKEGYNLRLTKNHLIKYVSSMNRYSFKEEWREAGRLQKGDLIVLQNHGSNNAWRGNYTHNDGYLMGMLIGDGTLKSDKAVLSAWLPRKTVVGITPSGQQAVMDKVGYMAMSLPHRTDFSGWTSLEERGEHRLSLASIKNLAEELGMRPGYKTITKIMEESSSEFCRGLLKGLFDTDGSVQGDQAKGVSVRLSQSNLFLLEAAQRMLLRLGIASRIYKNRRLEGTKILPDGRGGKKEYHVQSQHELVISGSNMLSFSELINFNDTQKSSRLEGLLSSYKRTLNRERFVATVEDIIDLPEEDVFDVQIPTVHAFDANGLYAHNCGEQPLSAWAVCNLGALNLAAYVTNKQFDYDSFAKDVKTAVRFLDNVIDDTHYFYVENEKVAKDIRRQGLGILGLADALIKMEERYGGEASLKTIDKIFKTLRDNAYISSSNIAKEKGSFPKFNKEKYLKGFHIKRLPEEIRAKIAKQGIRNAVLLTIAPTGSTSLLSGVSSGVEPVYEFEFIRRDRLGEHHMFHPLFEEWKKDHPKALKPDYFASANDLTPEEHVKVQAIAQEYIDASISKTVNAPKDHTVEDVKRLYMLAYDMGLKGITYMRDGSREGVLTRAEDVKPVAPVPQVQTSLPVLPRPMMVEGVTYGTDTPVGKTYITINHDENRQPFEVFITVGKSGSDVAAMADALGRMISLNLRINGALAPRERIRQVVAQLIGIGGARSVGFGENKVRSLPDAIAKVLSKHFEFRVNGVVEDRKTENGVSHSGNGISTHITNGHAQPIAADQAPKEEIVKIEQLSLQTPNGSLSTTEGAATGLYDICPECGGASLAYEEGCKKCYACGYSEC
jgi:ribonucleoside-diphosphate reductase alpha chain